MVARENGKELRLEMKNEEQAAQHTAVAFSMGASRRIAALGRPTRAPFSLAGGQVAAGARAAGGAAAAGEQLAGAQEEPHLLLRLRALLMITLGRVRDGAASGL